MSDTHKTSAMTRLRNYFLTGFVVCAPLAITAYIAWSFIGWVDSWVKPYIPADYNPDTYLSVRVPGFGLIVALVLITLIGFLTANIIGRTVISLGERILDRMPLVRSIYKALKQIFETALSNKNEMFRTVGLVEYPRKGVWSLVFVAGDKRTEINEKLDGDADDPLIGVFMPCTPNPTTGFLMYVRKSEIVLLDMSIEDGAKLIVSAGLVAPEVRKAVKVKGVTIEGGIGNPALADTDQPARSSRTASSRPNK
jgi:uncharacterized membrane protein